MLLFVHRDMEFSILIVLLSTLTHQVSAIRCLSCVGVLEPHLCNAVRKCSSETKCGVQKYKTISGEISYDLDCVSDDVCNMPSSQVKRSHGVLSEVLCQDCCDSEFCNVKGCGTQGYPQIRGPVCFSCHQKRDPSHCETLAFCHSDEMCAVYTDTIFGVHFYSSRCEPAYDCSTSTMVNPAPVGRRQIGAVTESRCAACCAVDYCNSQCGVSSTTSTSSVMSSTLPFTSISTLTESLTSFTHKITSASTSLTSPSSPLTSASIFPTVSAPSTTPFAVTSQIGTRFLVMVLPQYLSSLPNVPTLLISSKSRGEVFIEGPGNNGGPHSLSYGENQINLAQEVITHKTIIETKGVLISSTVPVSLALIDYEKDVSDMSLVFPVDICSREYVVPSYTPLQRSSVVGIAALENNTTISITIRMTNGSLSYGSKTYTDGDILKLTLNRLQTFSLTHNFDLSGSSIMSSKPVCVTSGSAASVAGDYGSRLEEMIFPTEQFSKLFIVPTFQTRPGVVIRVMSHRKPVLVDATSYKNWHLLLSNNSFHDINITSQRSVVISSNESVLVVAYVKSADYDLIGPFMVLIPGVDQYLNKYQFSVPDFGFTSYVSIVVPTNDTSGLRLDNNFVSPIRDSIATVVHGGKSYDIFSMYVSPGAHEMFHTAFTYFGLFVYGNQHADGYGYPAGVKFHIK